MPFLETQCRVI